MLQKCSKRSKIITTALSRLKLSYISIVDSWNWHRNYAGMGHLYNDKQLHSSTAFTRFLLWINEVVMQNQAITMLQPGKHSPSLRMQRNHSIEPSNEPFCGLVMSCPAICCARCRKHSMLEEYMSSNHLDFRCSHIHTFVFRTPNKAWPNSC